MKDGRYWFVIIHSRNKPTCSITIKTKMGRVIGSFLGTYIRFVRSNIIEVPGITAHERVDW